MLETCSTTVLSRFMRYTRSQALAFARSHVRPSWGTWTSGMEAMGRPCSRGSITRSEVSDRMTTPPDRLPRDNPLREFIERHPRLLVLTGAGCSTDSGIPDYRDENGDWKRARPVMFQAFVGDLNTRRRYWA